MRGVRFTKAETAWMLGWLQSSLEAERESGKRGDVRLGESVITKLEAAELPVRDSCAVKVTDAIAAFREVLGGRLIAPPFGAAGVLGAMKRRMAALGLSLTDCRTIAKIAGAAWRGPIRAESLVRQADKLLAESQGELVTDDRQVVSPVELNDDEI